MFVDGQLAATKFFVPVASGTVIARPRLTGLLQESLNSPVILICAPAGFGKTTLLSTWVRSLPPCQPLVAWISLDEKDNNPQLFWTNVLNTLKMQDPEGFCLLVEHLQSPQHLSLKYIVIELINLLAHSTQHFLLILDDYHLISEQEIHTTLSYLVEHLPSQLHLILATRVDPPLLLLPHLRGRRQVREIATEQLRCTAEETKTFFKEVMGTELADETIREVTARTEGWLVGLHLLALSLPEWADPLTLLEEARGDQHYILDYLTEEVLRRQPQEVQTFLLSTSILEYLTASLCNAIMQQANSQQMLERLEQANLFVLPLDSKRQWYRYHALFAQALRSQLERMQSDLALVLHSRASRWYAEHDQTTEAILHAFHAKEWQWAADLIERKSLELISLTWGVGQHALALFQEWIEQLPEEVMHARPRLCLACTQLLWAVAPDTKLDAWLDAAEAILTTSLTQYPDEDISYATISLAELPKQENLLGEVITFRAVIRSHEEDAQVALPLCQQALALLSADNLAARAFVGYAQLRSLYVSAANDAVAAIESRLQSGSLAQIAGKNALAIGAMGATVAFMIGAGRLREAHRLTQQAMHLGTQSTGVVSPDVCWPTIWQAEILREWNQLDRAQELIEEAISLCPQTASIVSIIYSLFGYVVLMRISLSRRDYDTACSALRQFEHISMRMNQPLSLHYRSLFTTVDQVRLWLACGELDRATRWAEELDLGARYGTPVAHEREEVACARILLATAQPTMALRRLEPVLVRAVEGGRWGHVIEIRLLQALAYQMQHYEEQAISALSVAVRLAEPEGYIRHFTDEGPSMAILLSRLQKQQREQGLTPYLDTLLAAFPSQSKRHKRQSKRSREHTERSQVDD